MWSGFCTAQTALEETKQRVSSSSEDGEPTAKAAEQERQQQPISADTLIRWPYVKSGNSTLRQWYAQCVYKSSESVQSLMKVFYKLRVLHPWCATLLICIKKITSL